MKWSNNNTPDRPQTSAPIPANTYENVKNEVANLDFTRNKNQQKHSGKADKAKASKPGKQQQERKQKLPEDPRDLAKMSPAKLEQMMQTEVANEPRKKGSIKVDKVEEGFMSLADLKKKLEGGGNESAPEKAVRSGGGDKDVAPADKEPAAPRVDVSNMNFSPRKKKLKQANQGSEEKTSNKPRRVKEGGNKHKQRSKKTHQYVPGRNDSSQVHTRTQYIQADQQVTQSDQDEQTKVQPNTKVTLS
jgi:hypothetical protein